MSLSQVYLLNFSDELRPRNEIIRANLYIIGAAFKRGLLHKCIEAVAGLSEIWQGLRFSYAHRLVLACQS